MSAAKPKTFSFQSQLPRLPIPPLKDTLVKYRQTLVPVLDPEHLARVDAIIQRFGAPGGQGEELQRRLQEHDRAHLQSAGSWLEPWWMTKAYHEWREPLLINSNWWMSFRYDHVDYMREAAQRGELERRGYGEFSQVQLRRAAGLVSNLLNFKELLESESIAPERTRAGPLCMNQFRHMFGVTRIPDMPADRIVTSFPCTARHITVLARDQIYTCDVYDRNGGRVSLRDLERQLASIVEDVQRLPPSDMQPAVCLLTSEHRDIWTKARQHLLSLHGGNKDTLHAIETSLFSVALDDFAPADSKDELHRHIAHGYTGHNRWYDKSLTVVVTSNGQAGCNGEHSPQDALTDSTMFEYVLQNEPALDPPGVRSEAASLNKPKRLRFSTDATIAKYIAEAEVHAHKLIADSDIGVLIFREYGTDFIKKAKMSPDAFFQMAMQLAYYRKHGRVTPTYETAGSRAFHHGRTETCRTLSSHSKKWVESMDRADVSRALIAIAHTQDAEKLALLRAALDAHVKYISEASQGKGVDRHLFGLRMLLRKGEKCELFDDPSYWKAQEWLLSTSGLGANSYRSFWGTGFGCVYPNGYGINYYAGPNQIHFGMESKNSSTDTSTDALRLHLTASLRDIKQLVERTQGVVAASTTATATTTGGSSAMMGERGDQARFPRASKL
ncbi:hypothetical protein RI367_003505 [Sorochytrium milnesiophthora]